MKHLEQGGTLYVPKRPKLKADCMQDSSCLPYVVNVLASYLVSFGTCDLHEDGCHFKIVQMVQVAFSVVMFTENCHLV